MCGEKDGFYRKAGINIRRRIEEKNKRIIRRRLLKFKKGL